MTQPSHRSIARAIYWGAFVWNVALVGLNVGQRRYEAAGVDAIVVLLLATWAWLVPKIDRWLDARLAEALARKRTAELTLAEFERLQRAGDLRVGVTVRAHAPWMN